MATTKTIYGQPFRFGDSILQDQTLVTSDGQISENRVCLIENIWDDLLSNSSNVKSNGNENRPYFYWEFTQTNIEGEDITVQIAAPKPKNGLFESPYDPETGSSDWAKFWLGKFKTAEENADYTIQPKEIVLHGTKYIDTSGDLVEVEERRIENNHLGDITNLLLTF